MKHTHMTAMFMIAIMALSVFAAVNVTTASKTQAVTWTTLHLPKHADQHVRFTQAVTWTTLHLPKHADQQVRFFLYGNVYDLSLPTVYHPGKWRGGQVGIQLYRQLPGQSSLTFWKTVITDMAGRWGTYDTLSAPGKVIYQAYYMGDNLFRGPSWSTQSMYIRYRTHLSISVDSLGNWLFGNTYWPGGYLKDQNGKKITGQLIYIYHLNYGTDDNWHLFTTTKVGLDGFYYGEEYSWWTTYYYAEYKGNDQYVGSISPKPNIIT